MRAAHKHAARRYNSHGKLPSRTLKTSRGLAADSVSDARDVVAQRIRRLHPARLRPKPLAPALVQRIRDAVDAMPAARLPRRRATDDCASPSLFWGDLPDTFASAELPALGRHKLPVVYVDKEIKWQQDKLLEVARPSQYAKQSYDVINYSCVGVHRPTNRILWVFICGEDDPAVEYCVRDAHDVIGGMRKYTELKSKTFYSRRFSKYLSQQRYGDYKGLLTRSSGMSEQVRYHGENYLLGMQRYFRTFKDIKGGNTIAYYPLSASGRLDAQWLEKMARLYTLLYALEKRYCPRSAAYRLFVAQRARFCGALPGMPLEMFPPTCMGSSINFASSLHADSSISGTLEAIIWSPPPATSNKKQRFVNAFAGRYFDLNRHALLFQVGTDYHGTVPTGEHGGCGFVNLSKSNLVADTPLSKEFYRQWKRLE
jgi:hypothetical protein